MVYFHLAISTKFKILFGKKLLHHLPLMSKVVLELIHCPGIILIDFKSDKQIDTKHFCIFFFFCIIFRLFYNCNNGESAAIIYFWLARTDASYTRLDKIWSDTLQTKFEAIHCFHLEWTDACQLKICGISTARTSVHVALFLCCSKPEKYWAYRSKKVGRLRLPSLSLMAPLPEVVSRNRWERNKKKGEFPVQIRWRPKSTETMTFTVSRI